MAMTLKTVEPRQGLVWVRQGVQEFFRHPLGYMALFMTFMLAGIPLSLLGSLGEVLLLAGIPLLSLAYMTATAGSLRGAAPRLSVFVAPWRHLPVPRRKALLTLSLGYAFMTLVLLMLCELIDQGGVQALMEAATAPEPDSAEVERLAGSPEVMGGILARIAVTVLLGIPFWHAPGLVCWGGQSPAQSLFSSVLALWHARGAFLLYGLGWAALLMAAATVMSLLSMLLGTSLVGLLTMPLALVLTGAFYASLFFTFRDSFGQLETTRPVDAAA